MKKQLTILASLVSCYASLFSFSLNAAEIGGKGENVLGVSGFYCSYNNCGGLGAYYQHSFSSHVRLQPEVGFVFSNKGRSAITISADMHFPFKIGGGIRVYPLVGLTYNNWHYTNSDNVSRIGGDLGAGFDFYMTRRLKLNLQGKYSFMDKISGAFINFGIGYIF